jgi:hypothetical protein
MPLAVESTDRKIMVIETIALNVISEHRSHLTRLRATVRSMFCHRHIKVRPDSIENSFRGGFSCMKYIITQHWHGVQVIDL